MKKILFFAAVMGVAFTSCMNEEFIGDNSARTGEAPISFNMNTPAMTRATEVGGATAATALNNEFIIWGEKNESGGTAAAAANQVFYNYKVNYTSNSAYTTTSNTKNWEYVGLTPYTSDKVYPALTVTQTIKYWDYSATSYTFTAVSAKPGDISDGKVKITKLTSGTTAADKGYEIAVNTGASLDDIFVADRNQPATGTGTDRDATNAYGGNVTMKFRNFMSKIRFGIYEDIPGYKVHITNVEYNSTGSSTTNKFGVEGKFLAIGDGSTTNTIFTVTYDENNKAVADIKSGSTPGTADYLETAQTIAGSPILSSTAASPISTTSSTPTWDKTGGAYTTILPYTTNATNMKVKIDFILTSTDTGETIEVSDATAVIPAAYCQWKSNYAYTYILKLNDNTNGQIGGVVGLYPITFDAVQVTDENGQAEYITTLSAPSITTFGVKAGKYETGGSEYAPGSDIYATFVEGTTVKTPTLGGSGAQHVNIYKVTTTDATNFPITEASVAEAIAANESNAMNVDIYTRTGDSAPYSYTKVTDATTLDATATYYKADESSVAPGETGYVETEAVADVDYVIVKIKAVVVNADASTNFTAVPEEVGSVPGEDGTTIYLSEELSAEPSGWATKYSMYYTDNTFATPASSTFSSGTYYRKFAIKLTGVKAGTYAIEYEASAAWTGTYTKVYKVIRVQ